jgi:hypothetical protein
MMLPSDQQDPSIQCRLLDHTLGSSRPDYIGSNGSAADVSTVSNPAVEETLNTFENESCDLLEILSAMRRYPNERRIQEKGCEKLWIQSWDDEDLGCYW